MNLSQTANENLNLPINTAVDEIALCKHCQTPFEPHAYQSQFCCHGCEQVYQLLHDQGFTKFYDLRGNQSLAPLRDTHLEDLGQVDWTWLIDAESKATAAANSKGEALAQSMFAIGGISCVACVWLIEALVKETDPRLQVSIYAAQGAVTLQWPVEGFSLIELAKRLAQCGYMLRPSQERHSVALDSQDGLGARTAICAGLSMNAMAFTLPFYHGLEMGGDLANLFSLVAAASATGSLLVGGTWFFKRAYFSLKAKQVSMDVPIALGLILAYFGSILGSWMKVEGLFYYDFVATFSFLMLLGRWIQHRVITRHQARMREFDPVPEQVTLTRTQSRVDKENLELGQDFQLASGLVLPVRAYLQSKKAEFALDWINGESEPIVKYRGEVIAAGARLLGRQSMEFRAAESWASSHVANLLQGDEESQAQLMAPWLEKLLRYYLSVVCSIALMGFGYWMLMGRGFGLSLQVMISVLIVSCPCALGLSIPIADARATALLRRLGVFVKRMDLFGRLSEVKLLVFDKTGTLSLEAPLLIQPEKILELNDSEKKALNTLIQGSRHPHCLGVREAMSVLGELRLQEAGAEVKELPGLGVEWMDEASHHWFLGKAEVNHQKVTALKKDGKLIVFFDFEERVRPDAKMTLEHFQKAGFKIQISSGDTTEKVKRMASVLGLPENCVSAEMTPDEKGEMIRSQDQKVLFLGDGANDVWAFKAAYCKGTPVAEKTPATQHADFYWQGVGLQAIQHLFEVAEQRSLAVQLAFSLSLIYNISVVAISLLGWMSPLVAAVVMPISSMITISLVTSFLRGKTLRG